MEINIQTGSEIFSVKLLSAIKRFIKQNCVKEVDQMNEIITYAYATSLQERIAAWKEYNDSEEQQLAYNEWVARKSTLTKEDYTKIFNYYHVNELQFGKGLLPLTQERAECLLPFVKTSEWFQLHEQLFNDEIAIQKKELNAGLRFHLAYYEKQIRQYIAQNNRIHFTESCIQAVVEELSKELFYLSQKTFVWDVHQMIEEQQLYAESKEAEFSRYIDECLGDKQRTALFYGAYPTLAKLLAIRLSFACTAIKEFITALDTAMDEMKATFMISSPMTITKIRMGQGDSHDCGKTVLQFDVQNQSFMFKFKNLEIGERFNQLLTFIETVESDASFYKIKRISYPSFTIEEKVKYLPCRTQEEVQAFYNSYGQLLAIAYWLGATDLHMENLIAHGAYPVLVDVETIIRPEMFYPATESRQNRIEKQSVIVSGLLPQSREFKQAYPIDALSGKKQKLTEKVNQLRDTKSSDIAFHLEEAYAPGAQNIPTINGKEVDYLNYREYIENGFQQMNECLLTHKYLFIEHVKQLFENVTIRLIYRDTQNYENVLNFGLHVDCMTNYLEREKVMANLWSSKNVPESLLPFEVEAMLNNDVPSFTANTSKTSVYAGGKEISNLLSCSPLDYTIQHIEQITKTTSRFSRALLRESISSLQYELFEVTVPIKNQCMYSPLLEKAADIGDQIITQLAINQNKRTVDWLIATITDEKQAVITYPDKNLYEGSAGVYLFFLYLDHFVPKNTYKEVIDLWETELFTDEFVLPIEESAFVGVGAQLFIAFYAWHIKKEPNYYAFLNHSLDQLKKVRKRDEKQAMDWLMGRASLLALLAEIYQTCQLASAYELLLDCAETYRCEEMADNSFAHGYAGVLYGLKRANEVLNNASIQCKIEWYKLKFEQSLAENLPENNSWCRGRLGLSEVAHQVNVPLPKEPGMKRNNQRKENACLCHGLYGNNDQHLAAIDDLRQKPIYLKGDQVVPSIGLFCGLSGIGYQLLRAYDSLLIKSLLFIN